RHTRFSRDWSSDVCSSDLGRLMRPRIVREIRSENGELIRSFEPEVIRQAVSPEAARMVREALAEVVSPRGTAILAAVQGFQVAEIGRASCRERQWIWLGSV